MFEKASSLKSEYVIIARGTLREREAKTDKIPTGGVELFVTELRVLSGAATTPFELRDEINVNDSLRLKYRYLDLRRPMMHEPIVLRSKIAKAIRDYYDANHFLEIETPVLMKSTPEGARDYLVPSRVQPGRFYALPQSPQLYKQILMLSGFDRYYQVARCFRDEDLRADRQPEFTQIDMEMSFVTEDDIMTMNEGLVKHVFKEILNVDVPTPFLRMPYAEAMDRFGSDKPDTRFGLELQNVTDAVRSCGFAVFKNAVEAGGSVRALNVKGAAAQLSRKEIDKLTEVARTYGAKGLAYTRWTADAKSSSFEKFLTEDEIAALYAAANVEEGDVLLIAADADSERACTALGAVRLAVGAKLGLIDKSKFNFLWVTDFPLFEYSEEESRFVAKHHPFTMPKDEDLDRIETDPGACRAKAYDMILNGCELGGGSIRINDPELQQRMFRALGFTPERAEESFGFLPYDKVRDKDAPASICLICEIAAWAKDQGKTLYDLLMQIYQEYGFSKEFTVNVVRPGKTGADEIKQMMADFRANPPQELGGSKVVLWKDYQALTTTKADGTVEKLDMPTTSNVLQWFMRCTIPR